MNYTKQQLEIINAPEERIVVMASAGTSKTTILTERIRRAITAGADPEKIVAITFTNQAGEEMRERLGAAAQGMFVGTVHSYANYLLKCIGIDTSNYIDEEKFDELFELVKQNPNCIQHIDQLYLDEAQDSDEQQFEFIFQMIQPPQFFILGDLKQCIYAWKGSRPDLFAGLAAEYGAKIYQLTENFRNSKEILNYAQWIVHEKMNEVGTIPYYDESIGLVRNKGFKTTLDYNPHTIIGLVSDENSEYKDWFILARSNSRVDEIYNLLKSYNIPVDTFKRADLSNSELHERMQANTVKVLTIHAAKGLEADKVIVIDAVMSREEECRIAYVAATRARHELYWMRKPSKKKKKTIYNWE